MSNLNLLRKKTKQQQAYERIITQIGDKINTDFPKGIKSKEEFLHAIIEECKFKGFLCKFQCKWG